MVVKFSRLHLPPAQTEMGAWKQSSSQRQEVSYSFCFVLFEMESHIIALTGQINYELRAILLF